MADVVGRTGHMDDAGNYVPETVTVRVEDPGGWAVVANDVDEVTAEQSGRQQIAREKAVMRKALEAQVAAGTLTIEEARAIFRRANV